MIENRAVGIKSREVYEAPAAIVLVEAHRALEDLVLTRDELRTKRVLETRWTELVYDGLWFSRLRRSIDAFVDSTQEVVTGRRSEEALYSETLASYTAGETFPHEAAEGFITIASLETELLARLARGRAAA
jgi:argininosuccinate synthase